MKLFALLVVLAIAASVDATRTHATTRAGANPVRRVVNMLQMMQKKVEAEGDRAKELYDKFMCYCENADSTLGKSIADAEEKIPQLESQIEETAGSKTQLEQDLADHKSTRADADKTMGEATAMREKEAAAFAAESADMTANIDALGRAIPAIAKGMGGAFLQTDGGRALRKVAQAESDKLSMDDRDVLLAFLEQKEGYAPASGEILGILKQMKEDMEKDLAELIATEESAKASYDQLMAAKEKEKAAATAAIEDKTGRKGDAAVSLTELKNDLKETKQGLAEDKDFLANLDKNCALKTKEWEAYQKTMAQEQLALADTIKLLNDDDALELFKKTVPGAAASSFIEVDVTSDDVKDQAWQLLQDAQDGRRTRSLNLDFIALALRGKKVGFGKVLKMVDDMVVLLKQEQVDDDNKKEYCNSEIDKTEDKIKESKHAISDLDAKIEDGKETLATVTEEIQVLKDGIVALDKQVAEATEQRKEENAAYTEDLAANNAAVQLIEMAKNRMNKFYNPKLYKAPPKRELSEEDRITLNMGGTIAPTAPPAGIAGTGITGFEQEVSFMQVRAHESLEDADAPPPPPAAELAYKKKGEESGGVIAMMDMLINDVKSDIQEMEADEKNAQADYEQTMEEAKAKRAQDSKAITDKEGVKATTEATLQQDTDSHKAETDNLQATNGYLADLHNECDWLLENFDARKAARADEVEALGKAKAVLSGADYSLLQKGAQTSRLRR